ncbi:DegP2 peptidase. Serine peptidase. MEROPS family S01B [Roseovarius pacificus]|uniref:DegP2 peptidase. Serine peptidase. MEROPS family S01B n=1 Tax=Roseovarius pacificus TaxID=337701 RepID=A0A1M7J3X6_9RHOB|nr:trypsin-like peptidase domain-containing protein [Roseovarius pacificus]GGO61792.1 2-alkenal reductase [Roseovarius pacificus]SHM47734.1 DegP2 peptidase. Serine peptidase. MEROPS family S01B [Roseovarius pacificus]
MLINRKPFVAFVIGLIVAGAAAFISADLWREPDAQIVTPRGALAPHENTTIALFETARGSVVSITTEERVLDPWSRRAMDVPRGTGSGFVWDDQGHIVTNNHVIAGASGARVRLADGRVLDAALVGTAPQHDLAVLRIDTGLDAPRPLTIGESGSLQVGQSVLAIGNPFGLDWTLTTGIVSALDREIPTRGGATIEGLIQTDAAINPGNSGGPLIDSAGRLIGVNTAIFSPSGSSAGIGFAVPVDTVSRVVPQLISTGTYRPPVLGIRHSDRINQLAAQQGLEGVLVLGVEPGSPAAVAGLRAARQAPSGHLVPGDVITAIDGRAIRSSEDINDALDAYAPGDRVAISLLRDGSELETSVVLASPQSG